MYRGRRLQLQIFCRKLFVDGRAANYLHDERGRELKIFIGYVIKGNGVPDVPDSKLWQMFKQTVAKVWNNNPAETVIVPYESCGVKSVTKKTLGKKFYPSNERDDVELFEQCLAECKDFCSNVDSVKIFEDVKYEIITAAQSIINRLQAEAQKKLRHNLKPAPTKRNALCRLVIFKARHRKRIRLQ